MNYYLLIAGILATACTFGQIFMGRKKFLAPVLKSSVDVFVKTVFHCMFYYLTIFFALSAITLLSIALGCPVFKDSNTLVHFIGANFTLFAVAQLILLAKSKVKKPFLKCFQWILFGAIGVLCCLGACSGGSCLIKM